jgi:hypothetical protein
MKPGSSALGTATANFGCVAGLLNPGICAAANARAKEPNLEVTTYALAPATALNFRKSLREITVISPFKSNLIELFTGNFYRAKILLTFMIIVLLVSPPKDMQS